jgi:hypothetical protein
VLARKAQAPFVNPRPKWIHVLFEKRSEWQNASAGSHN